LLESAETPKESEEPPKPKFMVESWDPIKDAPVEWLIESIIPKRAFAALYAPPASFKSFIALDIAEAVATGREWMGYKVPKKGAVLYIAGEGHGGMGARVKACKIQNNSPDGANLYVIRAQINIRSSQEDFDALINAINELIAQIDEPLELIILDTLMRMSGGNFNENSSEDMGGFISQTGKLQQIYNCALMVIHHSGKHIKGLRGHSSLLGAVDTELEIQRQDSVINSADPSVIGNAILTVSKQKDGADSIEVGIEIVLVEIGESSLGFETLTSLAIRNNQDILKPIADVSLASTKQDCPVGISQLAPKLDCGCSWGSSHDSKACTLVHRAHQRRSHPDRFPYRQTLNLDQTLLWA